MFIESPQSSDTAPCPLFSVVDPAGQPLYFPEMDYFASMDNSQFFLDPNFSFDPNMGFSDMSQLPAEPIHAGSGQQVKLKSRIRASRACIACRSRHMKCDSVEPVCTRCQLYDKTCVYTKSRRGGSHKAPPVEDPKTSSSSQTSGSVSGRPPTQDEDCSSKTSWDSMSNPRTSLLPNFSPVSSSATEQRAAVKDVDLITSYYEFFNNAHPVVLPRFQLLARVQSNPTSLEDVLAVIRYIGSAYLPEIPSLPYQKLAEKALNSSTLPVNGFSVQALTLFALARHCSDEYDIAEEYVDKAIDIALAIGMNHQGWAESNGEGDAMLTESWRRTWWALFTCDALFAAISHYDIHRLQSVEMDVDLPCEDSEYESGLIPTPHTFTQYDSREFLDQEITFSSFTYLIDAMRILSSLMSIIYAPHEPGDSILTTADAKFVNWFLYLPRCKQEKVRKDGRVDETMFLACLVVNTEKLLLHRPHSYLPYSPVETRSKCTPPTTHLDSRLLQQSLAMHTAKALEALSCSINLFALPGDNVKHSPIATCALALAIMAQVSACGFHKRGSWGGVGGGEVKGGEKADKQYAEKQYTEGRDRVRLGLGALRAGVKVWGLARRSVEEVAGIAKELIVGEAAGGRCENVDESGGNMEMEMEIELEGEMGEMVVR